MTEAERLAAKKAYAMEKDREWQREQDKSNPTLDGQPSPIRDEQRRQKRYSANDERKALKKIQDKARMASAGNPADYGKHLERYKARYREHRVLKSS